MDGPRVGADAGIDLANGDTGQGGGRSLPLNPVVPVGDDDALFGRGVEVVAHFAGAPSLVQG